MIVYYCLWCYNGTVVGLGDGEMSWSQPTVLGEIPSKRAAHAGCSFGRTLYVFGGMNETGALDDLYSLDTGVNL